MTKETNYRVGSTFRWLGSSPVEDIEISLTVCGIERCTPDKYYGPCIRNDFHVHFILSGKGTLRVDNTYYNLHRGQIFLIPPDIETYYYSDPYYQDPCLLITLANAPAFQLQNMEIGVVQSNSVRNNPELILLESYLVTHPSLGLRTRTYASYPDMLEALARGEIRAAAMVESCIGLYQEEYGVVSAGFSFGTVDYAICSPSDASALASVGSLLLQELKESGGLQSLYQANGLDVSHMPAEEAA